MTHEAEVVLDDKASDATESSCLILCPGKNLLTGATAFKKRFGAVTSLEEDLLRLASAVYAADVAFLREDRERYPRTIAIRVPVVNVAAFRMVKAKLQYCLSLLGGESWTINLAKATGTPEDSVVHQDSGADVLLFSGGLDSLAQAVELVTSDAPIALVSHDSGNPATMTAQSALLAVLNNAASPPAYFSFRVRGQNSRAFPYPKEHEGSQRTRSFLFLALGALVARRLAANRVLMMAENGQMAIHLPLTAARIGAFSTRTAFPEVLQLMQEALGQLLDFELSVTNPYLYATKAEVVEQICRSHAKLLPDSVSCWKASRVGGEANHCGFCIPCLVRRIALEHWGRKKGTLWARDLLREPIATLAASDDGKRNLMDLIEFVETFSGDLSEADLTMEVPELVNRYFDRHQAIDMYRRFALEARGVFQRYPSVRSLL